MIGLSAILEGEDSFAKFVFDMFDEDGSGVLQPDEVENFTRVGVSLSTSLSISSFTFDFKFHFQFYFHFFFRSVKFHVYIFPFTIHFHSTFYFHLQFHVLCFHDSELSDQTIITEFDLIRN